MSMSQHQVHQQKQQDGIQQVHQQKQQQVRQKTQLGYHQLFHQQIHEITAFILILI